MRKIGLFIFVFGMGFAYSVLAATEFRLDSPVMVAPGDEFTVRILAASDQPLNAYSARLNFDPRDLEFVRTDNSRSIVDIWPQLPVVFADGSVRFDGASTMPFLGRDGELFTVRFRALHPGSTTIVLDPSFAYLANGKGTKMPLPSEAKNIRISASAPRDSAPAAMDNTPPEISFLGLQNDPLNPEQELLGFKVQDSGSGVVDVSVRSMRWAWWENWRAVRNPSAYPKDVWLIQFSVTDNSGNRTTSFALNGWVLVFKIAVLAGSIGLMVALLRRIKKMVY